MKLLIDKLKLKLLLEKKRAYIGNNLDGLDVLFTAIIYMISLLCSEFKDIFGINRYVIGTLAWGLAFGILFYGIYRLWRSRHCRYNHEILFHEIENLNEVLHRFSIVAVKDSFNPYPNRFLLHYDEVWKCWFFFSFHTSEYQNEENIKQRLSNQLKIDPRYISIQYISDRVQPKYSERDRVNKVYQHSLYQGIVAQFPDSLKQDEFELDGVRYRWWTIEEMEQDENIQEKNRDVVAFVKEKIS